MSLKLSALLGLVVLVALALVASVSAVTCGVDFASCNAETFAGTCYEDTGADTYCACRSGVSGASCEVALPGECTPGELNVTATEYPPIAVSVLFAADVLSVSVSSPLVTQRNYTVIAIDDSAFDDARCTYPGAHWSRAVDTCTDVFSASMPWADNVACGWEVDTSDVSFSVYSAQMVVRHHDVSVPFGSRPGSSPVERVVDHLVPLTISFPRNVTVTSDIVVQAPVLVLMAVSLQSVSVDGTAATLELTSNVLWPYTLTNFTLVSTPGGTGASYTPSPVSSTCANDGASSCTQVWRISIATGELCTLNGDYQLWWNLTCQLVEGVNPPACAILDGDGVQVGLTTNSESFCTVVSTVLPLTGALASYQDAAFAQNKTQFLVGQTLYYVVTMASPNVTLAQTTINSVKLTSGGQEPVILYSALAVTEPVGTAAEFTPLATTANTAAFSFALKDSFIDAIPDDSSRTFTTVVIVDVEYDNVITKKRGVERIAFTTNLNTQPVGLSSSFVIDSPAGNAPLPAAATRHSSALVALVASLALIFANIFAF